MLSQVVDRREISIEVIELPPPTPPPPPEIMSLIGALIAGISAVAGTVFLYIRERVR